jgi:hypothetical protein
MEAAEALSPSAMAATGVKDPRHFVKARRCLPWLIVL